MIQLVIDSLTDTLTEALTDTLVGSVVDSAASYPNRPRTGPEEPWTI